MKDNLEHLQENNDLNFSELQRLNKDLENNYEIHQNNNFLSNLLPYDSDSRNKIGLQIALKEYQMLLLASLEAIKALNTKKLEEFDSLVGENACEIRAVCIALISSKNRDNLFHFKDQLAKIEKKITILLQDKAITHLMQSKITLKNVLENEGLLIPLSFEQAFIIKSFLLSAAKNKNSSNESISSLCVRMQCSPKNLKKFGDVSSNFTEQLVRKLRKLLSAASVQFVREHAFKLGDTSLIKMVSSEFTVSHNTCWPCTPMFWTYKTMLSIAQKNEIPLILHAKFLKKMHEEYKIVDQEYMLFESERNKENSAYFVKNGFRQDVLNKEAWVIQGVVCPDKKGLTSKDKWKISMAEHSIIGVILAGAADHRQYPDPNPEHMIEALNDHEYNHYKALAMKEGFALENPTKFFIQHVYAIRVGDFVDQHKNYCNIY